MIWGLLAVFAYVLLAAVSLGDRKLLKGPMPDPKVYAFYVGALGLLVLLAVPFLGFPVPSAGVLIVAMMSGALFIMGAFALYFGLHYFEASRIVPASGALTPIFTLLLTYFIFPDTELSMKDGAAFALLIFGIVLLTYQRSQAKLTENIVVAAAASWLFGASFALAKFTYTFVDFWTGFLWMRIGGGLCALLIFLLFVSVRNEVLKHRKTKPSSRKVAAFFLFNQALGAAAIVMQSAAVSIAPVSKVAFVNALQGIQYAILFGVEFLRDVRSRKRSFDRRVLSLRAGGVLVIAVGLTIFALR
jgi:drug/metabolite transporter (DMT)-like permease